MNFKCKNTTKSKLRLKKKYLNLIQDHILVFFYYFKEITFKKEFQEAGT